MHTNINTVVVGAGVTGLSASYHLKKRGIDHVVFERGKIGQSWRSQRWDSFRLNSLNKLNGLADASFNDHNPNGFGTAPEFVSSFEQYVSRNDLPVTENAKVISIEKAEQGFDVRVEIGGVKHDYHCRNVVIASGRETEIRVPSFAKNISRGIKQLHTSEYKNPAQLNPGAALVVGSAQSGIQIADDIASSGKKVYLSTSMVARVPRFYRGRDIMEWLIDMKFFEMRAEDIQDPAMLKMRAPQIAGTGGNKYTISLQALAKKGAMILGKMDDAKENEAFFQPNAAMHIKFADGFSQKVKDMVNGFIMQNKIDAPAAEPDEADQADENASCACMLTSINLKEHNITSIVWATGFNSDLSYIKLPIHENNGDLKQTGNMSPVPGLYFLGWPWLRGRKSQLIFGMKEDAAFVADSIAFASQQRAAPATASV